MQELRKANTMKLRMLFISTTLRLLVGLTCPDYLPGQEKHPAYAVIDLGTLGDVLGSSAHSINNEGRLGSPRENVSR